MRLACVGPLRPLRTGVADFSESLVPFLAEHCEVSLFAEGCSPLSPPVQGRFPVAGLSEFLSSSSAFDAILYHMGNHYRFHRRIFDAFCRVPGITLLHDCVLNQFFSKYALERGNFGSFERLLRLCYPELDDAELSSFFRGQGDPYRFPMGGIAAMFSRGTIVMNEYGQHIIEQEAPKARVLRINFPYVSGRAFSETVHPARESFGISDETFVVASIGHITPAKRIHVALQAFEKFHREFPNSVLLLAGQLSASVPLPDMIRKHVGCVRYLGYLDRAELDGLIDITDVCINLRYPSNGEMSSTLIDMLGRGKVVVVSNYAQFAEFPDKTCVKIDIGSTEVEDLAGELTALALDKPRRNRIGQAARDYIERNHSADSAASAMMDFIKEHATARPLLTLEEIDKLLRPDGSLKRYGQLTGYNTRRFLSHIREHGPVNTLCRVPHHIFSGARREKR